MARPIVHDELGVDIERAVHVPKEENDLLVTFIGRAGDVGLNSCNNFDLAADLAYVLHGANAAVAG